MYRFLAQIFLTLFFGVSVLSLSACYNQGRLTPDAWDLTEQQLDSISFYTTHHYTQNFNFLVQADSVHIIQQLPTEYVNNMPVDTLTLLRGDHIVVADITTQPTDTLDSVWVKVARDQETLGWLHEAELLPAVSPDDPISRFIDFFSNAHLLIFLAFCVVTIATYVLRILLRRNAKLVHVNDIPSFYPTLLCLLVASSAVLYSSIQLFAPETWRHFYYHPTLNPYALPTHLGLFIVSVWAILIVVIAVIEETTRLLPLGEAFLYLLGLAGVCAVAYVVFSISTLYFVGYLLLPAYIGFAIYRYMRFARPRYRCGHCGMPLRSLGPCPNCGSFNDEIITNMD